MDNDVHKYSQLAMLPQGIDNVDEEDEAMDDVMEDNASEFSEAGEDE